MAAGGAVVRTPGREGDAVQQAQATNYEALTRKVLRAQAHRIERGQCPQEEWPMQDRRPDEATMSELLQPAVHSWENNLTVHSSCFFRKMYSLIISLRYHSEMEQLRASITRRELRAMFVRLNFPRWCL